MTANQTTQIDTVDQTISMANALPHELSQKIYLTDASQNLTPDTK